VSFADMILFLTCGSKQIKVIAGKQEQCMCAEVVCTTIRVLGGFSFGWTA